VRQHVADSRGGADQPRRTDLSPPAVGDAVALYANDRPPSASLPRDIRQMNVALSSNLGDHHQQRATAPEPRAYTGNSVGDHGLDAASTTHREDVRHLRSRCRRRGTSRSGSCRPEPFSLDRFG
jgi:hypothetical protein